MRLRQAQEENSLDAWACEIAKAGKVPTSVAIQVVEKSAEEERYTLGVVLEPTKELDKPDSQADIYSAAEVRKAAFDYMMDSQRHKIQHKGAYTNAVKIVESYVTPVDMVIGGRTIAKGTWMMGMKYLADDLWDKVKSGEITGYSIGGVAMRTPVN